MRISDWSSDVCSSDLGAGRVAEPRRRCAGGAAAGGRHRLTVSVHLGAGLARPWRDIPAAVRRHQGGQAPPLQATLDRKSGVYGKEVAVRVDLGGRRYINKKTKT